MSEENKSPFDSYEHLELEWDQDYDQVIGSDVSQLDEVEILRLEVNEGLEDALSELSKLSEEYGENSGDSLIEQCKQTAIDTITSQFGLAMLLNDSKDGGNVTTLHNFENEVFATYEDENRHERYRQAQENYDRKIYDKELRKTRKEYLQGKSEISDTYTKEIHPTDGSVKIDLDHIISIKGIEKDIKNHFSMSPEEKVKMATSKKNLAFTKASINRSKKHIPLTKWGEKTNKNSKTNFERYGIDKEHALKKDTKARKHIKNTQNTASLKKYGKEIVSTGATDAAQIVAHSAFGSVMREFIQGTFTAVKEVFAEKEGKSFQQLLAEFKEKMKLVLQRIKNKWKDILKESLEGGITAFFSNLLVFVINLFVTTIKKIVVMIRAGFVSLVQAIKILTSPPAGMSKEEARYHAAKILVAGVIGAGSLGLSAAVEKFLQAIPGLQPIMMFPIPGEGRTISDILAVTLSAVLGGLLTTIVIYFMDKFRKEGEKAKLQIQLVYQSNIVSYYKVAQSYLVLHDAYKFMSNAVVEGRQLVMETKHRIEESFNEVSESSDALDDSMKLLEDALNKGGV